MLKRHDSYYAECSGECWITSSNIEMIEKSLQSTDDPAILEFCRTNRKRLYKGGNKSFPNFTVDANDVLLHIKRIGKWEEKREVVDASRAREIIKVMHTHASWYATLVASMHWRSHFHQLITIEESEQL